MFSQAHCASTHTECTQIISGLRIRVRVRVRLRVVRVGLNGEVVVLQLKMQGVDRFTRVYVYVHVRMCAIVHDGKSPWHRLLTFAEISTQAVCRTLRPAL